MCKHACTFCNDRDSLVRQMRMDGRGRQVQNGTEERTAGLLNFSQRAPRWERSTDSRRKLFVFANKCRLRRLPTAANGGQTETSGSYGGPFPRRSLLPGCAPVSTSLDYSSMIHYDTHVTRHCYGGDQPITATLQTQVRTGSCCRIQDVELPLAVRDAKERKLCCSHRRLNHFLVSSPRSRPTHAFARTPRPVDLRLNEHSSPPRLGGPEERASSK